MIWQSGYPKSGQRKAHEPRPICGSEGGERWVSNLERKSLFPMLKISPRDRDSGRERVRRFSAGGMWHGGNGDQDREIE